jgi:anti-sigma regulatory factor (Ser/Thr protein kinase)
MSNDVQPIPLLSASLRLAAVPLAVATSRSFTEHTLSRWNMADHIEAAALVMSELVTNAVKASGATDPNMKPPQTKSEHVVGVQLRAIEASVHVEVWDAAEEAPVRRTPAPETEGGRGLLLVDALAKRWSIFRPMAGGKVVSAELPLGLPVEPLVQDTADDRMVLPDGIRAWGPVAERARSALFEYLMETTVSTMCARVNDGI